MTTDEDAQTGANLERLNANLAKIETLSQRLVGALARRRAIDPHLQGPGQELMLKAATAYMTEMMQNPARLIEHQVSYWGKALKHYVEAQQALASGRLAAPEDHTAADRRFNDPLWQSHPWFNFLKQQYLMGSEAVETAVDDLEGLAPEDRRRVAYFSRQIMDMMAPTNFLATNPQALARAVETDGQSLVDGLENLVRDLEANDGEVVVSLVDRAAFEVGGNIATTPGKVVFRNHLFELIQYAPATEQVRAVPLLIFPPWINKFYILDLTEKNSLIRWIVSQGYTLFVVSWINPDPSYADVGLDDYVEEGFLRAITEVRAITGEEKINTVGYCIAGTTLSLALALLNKRGQAPVRSATFFTTLTDFSDQGEFGVFLTDDFVDGIEREVMSHGILSSFFMARTFSYLRSNDLVYGPAVRSYMMGQRPPAFDLLFWNADSTNLPARMTVDYLRGLCQQNRFADGGFEICGERLNISDVTVPLFAIGCETDHIAAWAASYNGVRQMGSRDKTFLLSESGHIAGIVNPPAKRKYGHYTADAPLRSTEPEEWRKLATHHEGSWWPRWEGWLKRRSGKMVPARAPASVPGYPALADAPGTYVRMRGHDQGPESAGPESAGPENAGPESGGAVAGAGAPTADSAQA